MTRYAVGLAGSWLACGALVLWTTTDDPAERARRRPWVGLMLAAAAALILTGCTALPD